MIQCMEAMNVDMYGKFDLMPGYLAMWILRVSLICNLAVVEANRQGFILIQTFLWLEVNCNPHVIENENLGKLNFECNSGL